MKPIEKLLRIIGSPFIPEGAKTKDFSDQELLEIYDLAFENRVALLYLELYRKPGWAPELEKKYQMLKKREQLTLEVIKRLANTLNKQFKDNYVIFKSIKPYPATPNDTDVLFLGSKKEYENAYNYLLERGYIFHEWAPQQRTVVDPNGKDKIGKGKKGGIYYIDLYEEISTDYYAYLDKRNLVEFIFIDTIDSVEVNLLASEPELAIIMFHNVFPERTFQLEHFYLPLYYFAKEDFSLQRFLSFVIENKLSTAVQANLSLIAHIHKKNFGFVPDIVKYCMESLGENIGEVRKYVSKGESIPYLFSGQTFWRTFINKSFDLYSFKSLITQIIKMINPVFFIDVVKSLKARLGEKGVYHLER